MIDDEKYRIALAEIDDILKFSDDEILLKISESFKKFVKENKDKKYISNINNINVTNWALAATYSFISSICPSVSINEIIGFFEIFLFVKYNNIPNITVTITVERYNPKYPPAKSNISDIPTSYNQWG